RLSRRARCRRAQHGARTAVPRSRACATLCRPVRVRPPEPCRPRLGRAWTGSGRAGGAFAMGVVALPRIIGLGRREADWRRSRWLAALDERTPAELLLGWQRVVLVSPHPDDETLACGGLLRAAGAMGLDVHLVSVTDGEACYPGNARWTPERLRAVRSGEVAHAIAALGVRAQVHRLGLPDGDVDGHREALEATLRSMLRPGDLVLAPWEQDGHPDHDA